MVQPALFRGRLTPRTPDFPETLSVVREEWFMRQTIATGRTGEPVAPVNFTGTMLRQKL